MRLNERGLPLRDRHIRILDGVSQWIRVWFPQMMVQFK